MKRITEHTLVVNGKPQKFFLEIDERALVLNHYRSASSSAYGTSSLSHGSIKITHARRYVVRLRRGSWWVLDTETDQIIPQPHARKSGARRAAEELNR